MLDIQFLFFIWKILYLNLVSIFSTDYLFLSVMFFYKVFSNKTFTAWALAGRNSGFWNRYVSRLFLFLDGELFKAIFKGINTKSNAERNIKNQKAFTDFFQNGELKQHLLFLRDAPCI